MARRKAQEIDCIALKRRLQARVRQAVAGMSPEQEFAYLREQAIRGPLGDFYRTLFPPKERARRPRRAS